ncbi:hypothetical protein TorRG33x02_204490 [Trema orientale]|uniref:Uncharacterized protein n=1 Tax=Trema orientale TaxID=63057 RepID=A0A2P5EE27_TREOI|nr:hypothetical protein TorRG33x02_204490 [Trema orientale]
MNIFSKGPACEDDFEAKENRIVSETEERDNLVMDMMMNNNNNNNNNQNHSNGVEFEFEIWPVEHPMEPPDEDRPVKCPIPHSSIINEEGKREKRLAESLNKRAEECKVGKKGEEEEEKGSVIERPVRAVRKRHHMTLTGENEHNDSNEDDNTISPLSRMPPLPPLPTQNLTIFQMLQQFDEFES